MKTKDEEKKNYWLRARLARVRNNGRMQTNLCNPNLKRSSIYKASPCSSNRVVLDTCHQVEGILFKQGYRLLGTSSSFTTRTPSTTSSSTWRRLKVEILLFQPCDPPYELSTSTMTPDFLEKRLIPVVRKRYPN